MTQKHRHKSDTVRLTIDVPARQHTYIKMLAAREGVSLRQFVIEHLPELHTKKKHKDASDEEFNQLLEEFLVCGHPLNDGNKRTGAGSAYLFLRINKARILFENYMENEIFEDFILKVSNSKKTKKRSHIFLSMEDSEIMANLAENDPSLRSAEGLSFFSG